MAVLLARMNAEPPTTHGNGAEMEPRGLIVIGWAPDTTDKKLDA